MKRCYTTILFLLTGWRSLHAQDKMQFRDFVLDRDRLWALTTNGKLVTYDLQHVDAPPIAIPYDDSIVTLTKDRQSAIVVCDSSGHIQRYDPGHRSWNKIDSYKGKLYTIVFDGMNHFYLVTPKGVVDGASKEIYFPERSTNPITRYKNGWGWHAPAYCMDSKDNLWLGFRYGEWGGEISIFNTRNRRFLIPEEKGLPMSFNPVQGICTGGDSVYVTTGLNHLGLTEGRVIIFEHLNAKVIFNGDPDTARYKSNNGLGLEGEYIGPVAFNRPNHCLYFYSQHGIFKGDISRDLSKLDKWEKVATPELLWSWGQPDAVGADMNMLKMEFTDDGRLIFLSQLNGIGVIDKGSVSFFP